MHLTTGIIVEALFNAFALCAFCKFVLFSMFEMRYFTQVSLAASLLNAQ